MDGEERAIHSDTERSEVWSLSGRSGAKRHNEMFSQIIKNYNFYRFSRRLDSYHRPDRVFIIMLHSGVFTKGFYSVNRYILLLLAPLQQTCSYGKPDYRLDATGPYGQSYPTPG